MAPDLSFTKEERLKNPGDFKRVYSQGKRVRTRSFVVYALPNGNKTPRLGLSVSARTANSPGRARIKRLLREFFRLNKARFSNKILPGTSKTIPSVPPRLPAGHADALDVVISAKTPAATLGLKDVEEEITEALSRLNRAFL